MNPPHTAENSHPPPRTSVLNLVIQAPDRAAEAQAVLTLGQLAQRHLSRTLVITEDAAAAEPGFDASVTTRCQIRPSSAGQICLEEVRITTRGTPATHLASIVAPLLLADLPVVLWWLGEPPEPGADVLDLADQLIVDSRSFTATGFGRFALLVGAEGNRLRFADLAWSSTDRWRELLARLFDPVEARSYQPTEREATFETARLDDGACATMRTRLAGQSGTTSVVPLTSPPVAAMLSRVLSQLDRDSIYETSLATAGRIAE